MIFLKLNAAESFDVFEALIKTGHYSLANEIKSLIVEKLDSTKEIKDRTTINALFDAWYAQQSIKINALKEGI